MVQVLTFNLTGHATHIDKEQMVQGYIYMGKINLEQSQVAASTNYDGEDFINSIK